MPAVSAAQVAAARAAAAERARMASLPVYIQQALAKAAAARKPPAPQGPKRPPPKEVPPRETRFDEEAPPVPRSAEPTVPAGPPVVPLTPGGRAPFPTAAAPVSVAPRGAATAAIGVTPSVASTGQTAARGLGAFTPRGLVPVLPTTGAFIPSIVHGDISQRIPPNAVINTPLTRIVESVNRAASTVAPTSTTRAPRVPLGSKRTVGDQVYQVASHDPYGNPVYRQVGSAGPPDFRTLMTDLAIKALSDDPAVSGPAQTRFMERLRFVNMGFGGSQASHDSAVVNLALQLNRGNYPDIVSDQIVRELPWQQLGFASYQAYLRYLRYQDLGNGTWRRLTSADRAALGIPSGPGGGDGETGSSGAPGSSSGGRRGSFFDLVAWRI